MAEDAEGQQITVAELLKRMGAEQQDAPTGRRRRRADEGGVSVSELTGEIPRITGDTELSGRAARRRAREQEEAAAAARGETPESTTTSSPTSHPPQSPAPAERADTAAAASQVEPTHAVPRAGSR